MHEAVRFHVITVHPRLRGREESVHTIAVGIPCFLLVIKLLCPVSNGRGCSAVSSRSERKTASVGLAAFKRLQEKSACTASLPTFLFHLELQYTSYFWEAGKGKFSTYQRNEHLYVGCIRTSKA
jgi:hypothetical protein